MKKNMKKHSVIKRTVDYRLYYNRVLLLLWRD